MKIASVCGISHKNIMVENALRKGLRDKGLKEFLSFKPGTIKDVLAAGVARECHAQINKERKASGGEQPATQVLAISQGAPTTPSQPRSRKAQNGNAGQSAQGEEIMRHEIGTLERMNGHHLGTDGTILCAIAGINTEMVIDHGSAFNTLDETVWRSQHEAIGIVGGARIAEGEIGVSEGENAQSRVKREGQRMAPCGYTQYHWLVASEYDN